MTEYDRAVAACGQGCYAYARCTLLDLRGRTRDKEWYVAKATGEQDPWLPPYWEVTGDALYEREGHYDHRGVLIPFPRYRLDIVRLRPPDPEPVQGDLFS